MDIFNRLSQPNVTKMAKDRDVSGLVRALSHSDPKIRKAAEFVVQALAGEDVTDALLRALAQGDAQSAKMLGKRGDERAIPALIEALSSPEMSIHQNSRAALITLEATEALRHAFRQAGEPQARQLALRALQELAPGDLEELLVEALEDPAEQVRRLAYWSGVRPRLLHSPNPDLRLSAVRALAWCERPLEEESLLEALDDEVVEIRSVALEGLSSIWADADPSIKAEKYSLVKPMFQDSSRDIRTAVCSLAGKLGTGLPELLASLEDADDLVRNQAALSLGKIGGPEARDSLIKHLQKGSWAAARALGEIGDKAAVPALIEALKCPETAACAAESLGLLGDPRAIIPLQELAPLKSSVPRDRDGPSLEYLVEQALERLKG